MRLWKIEARFFGIAQHVSHLFGAILFAAIVGTGLEAIKVSELRAEARRAEQLVRLEREQREITCLTNVTYHEARGEIAGARELVAKTVLAIISDRDMDVPRTICELSKVRGFFSGIKDTEMMHFGDSLWKKIYGEMSDVYYGPRTLPRGWGCVRGFRVSDDELEKLGHKAIAQLGFTVEAKGLKYFAAHRVPVDTRGKITFYAPRGGCTEPAPTT